MDSENKHVSNAMRLPCQMVDYAEMVCLLGGGIQGKSNVFIEEILDQCRFPCLLRSLEDVAKKQRRLAFCIVGCCVHATVAIEVVVATA